MLGPAGIGKSTVCLQALHDRRIAERFDGRRYFVRLDGASHRQGHARRRRSGARHPGGPGEHRHRVGHLAGQPAALALDNLETPWEAETLETEALLAELAAVPGLSLTVTLRSRNQAGGVAWREADRGRATRSRRREACLPRDRRQQTCGRCASRRSAGRARRRAARDRADGLCRRIRAGPRWRLAALAVRADGDAEARQRARTACSTSRPRSSCRSRARA